MAALGDDRSRGGAGPAQSPLAARPDPAAPEDRHLGPGLQRRPWVGRLDTARAAQAVAEDVETYDHVRAASADLTADPRRPQLHLYVTADPSADITALDHRIATHTVARLRRALDADATIVDLMVTLRADRDIRQKSS